MTSTMRDDQLRLLFQLDADLNRIQDLDILLEEILRGARTTVNAEAGSLYLVEGKQLHFRYSQNDVLEKKLVPGEKLVYSIFSLAINNRSVSGYTALTGEAVNIPDAYAIPKKAPYRFAREYDDLSHYRTQSILTVPLKTYTGAVLGVLQLINARTPEGEVRVFDAEDEQFVGHYAANATMALQRAQLTRTMILRMIQMAELRDPRETGPHVNRVGGYAAEIYQRWAQKRGLPAEEIARTSDAFRMAAMLHDVGKVGIDDKILRKPAKLDPEEYETMKTHTQIGASLFADPQSAMDQMAAQVTATHHERWDGTGYPNGLRGEAIPIWGRIVAVADVYDALTCHRVYKQAWTKEAALDEIKAQSGRHFDPELVEILLEVLPVLQLTFDRYPDVF